MNPVNIFKRDDFPAPLGPIIAVNSPDLNVPETPFNIGFLSAQRNIQILIIIIFGREQNEYLSLFDKRKSS